MGEFMKKRDVVIDHEMGMIGILVRADDFYPQLWHVYYENGRLMTAYENALEVISEGG